LAGRDENSNASSRQPTKVTPAHDALGSEAIYLRDPDKNSIELSWDRPQAEWPLTKDGHLEMETRPLDMPELLGELTT
jgi:catechol 2,3-dioxygenase